MGGSNKAISPDIRSVAAATDRLSGPGRQLTVQPFLPWQGIRKDF
jgi:hypothetical protein